MFRHGWPQPTAETEDGVPKPSGKPDLGRALQNVARQLSSAAAHAPAQAREAAAGAVQRLQTARAACGAAVGQDVSGSGQRQLALACLSSAMLQRQRESDTLKFRGRGLQQVFGDLAEAPSRPEGKLEVSSQGDQQPEEDAMAAEERILISEVSADPSQTA